MPDSQDQGGMVVTVPRFTEEQWKIILDHWDDTLETLSYGEQRSLQSKIVRTLKDEGTEVQEIPMDPKKMLSWLRKNNHKNDSHGRATYYAEVGRCRHLGLPEPE